MSSSGRMLWLHVKEMKILIIAKCYYSYGNLAILVSVDTNIAGAEYFIPGEGSPGNYCNSTKL